ncbi:MAG: hypothetical protein PVH13_11310 [Gammaproteobacteria bacterium]|jgi:hypothetical protein
MNMTFPDHVRQILRITSTLSLAAGSMIAVIVVAASGIDIGFELEADRADAIWILLGLPLICLIAAMLLSPLSYIFDRMLFRRRPRTP